MSGAQRQRLWPGVALLLTALKLWLSRGQGVYAIGSAALDDRLFVDLAGHLARGEWLGPYNELTLAKGPFYPLFIAAAFLVGLPLFLAQHLFYAAACALFVRALRPAIPASGLRLAIYALLLWNPMTFDAPGMGRVLRQQVYGPLALMMIAALVALHVRRTEPGRRLTPWALLLGLAAGAFYLTREESLWFAPSVLLLAGAGLWSARQISGECFRRSVRLLGFALAVASLPVLVVCAFNKRHYGWFGTCEFRSTQFQDAYGAMLRVRVGPELAHVPVTREARIAMARVSPRFAQVQQKLEGGVAQGWAGASEFFTHLPPAEGQVGGGWFMWAFREATAQAGYHKSAALALDFYRKLARELNQACDDGRLPAGPARSGFMPRWQGGDTGPFLLTTWDFADFVVRFSRFSGRPPPSSGAPEDLQLFRDITRERLSPPEGELDVVGADRYLLNLWKADVLHRVGKALRPLLTGLFVLAQILAVIRTGWMLAGRRWSYPLTVAAAAWGACLASVAMHAMIEVTSFPVLTVTSFAPIYPLLLVFVVAVFWDVAVAWGNRPRVSAPPITADLPAPEEALPAVPRTRFERMLPFVLGLAALLPFVVWQRAFRELCWFGDDFFLLDQWAEMGLRKWSTVVFAENFVPVFKVLWAGVVTGFGGSYPAMLWALWLTHAINTALFGRLLQRAGFSLAATLTAAVIFALTPINLETLGWSVQWSALLATTFLLFALGWLERHHAAGSRWQWRIHVPLILLVAASAGSFSRGVLTGGIVALGLLLPALRRRDWREAARRLPAPLGCLLPAVAVAVVIKLNASGNHQQLAGHSGAMLVFGASYFLLNPLTDLLHLTSAHPVALGFAGIGKVTVIIVALRLARGRVWHLLVLVLAYDLGNAVLLGIGRYHTGFEAALSSRYQYSSLLAFLPFVGALVVSLGERWRAPASLRWVALGGLALWSLGGWPAELAEFTRERGTEVRRLLAAPATSDPALMVPGLEFMHIERAKALQRAYGLH